MISRPSDGGWSGAFLWWCIAPVLRHGPASFNCSNYLISSSFRFRIDNDHNGHAEAGNDDDGDDDDDKGENAYAMAIDDGSDALKVLK